MTRFRRLAGRQVGCAQVADIAVAAELAPGPAITHLEDGDRFAGECLGVAITGGVRGGKDGRDGGGDDVRLALNEASRRDQPLERPVREVIAIGVAAAFEFFALVAITTYTSP